MYIAVSTGLRKWRTEHDISLLQMTIPTLLPAHRREFCG